MLNYIFRQWKTKKVTIILIIMGFFVGSFVLSIGTSITVENYNYIYDQTSGNPDNQLEITIKNENDSDLEDIEKLLNDCSKYGEIQILNMENVVLNDFDKDYQIVPVILKEDSSWHIPLIGGRYFKASDSNKKDKEVIVGKNIASKHGIKVNDTILVNNEEYNVIAVCGRNIRETQWDDVIYVDYSKFIEQNEKYVETLTSISCLLKDGKQLFTDEFSELSTDAENKNIKIYYEELDQTLSFSSFTNSLIITVASSIVIFIVAIINIVNLMIYWISERRREFGIMKAIGADNRYIVKWIIIEVIIMTLISAILAITVQSVVFHAFGNILVQNNIYFSISLINFVVSISVATICGLIAAIVPAIKTIKIQPVEVIQYE